MVRKILSLFKVETRRLLWLLGIIFLVIIAVQYFELPCGNIVLSLFSSVKDPVVGKCSFQNEDTSEFEDIGKIIVLNGTNCTSTYADHEIFNSTETSEGRETDQKCVIVPGGNVGSNISIGLGLDMNSGIEPSSGFDVLLNKSTAVDDVKKYDAFAPEGVIEPNQSFAVTSDTSGSGSASEEAREPRMSFSQTNDTWGKGSAPDEDTEPEQGFVQKNGPMDGIALVGDAGKGNVTLTAKSIVSLETGFASPSPALPPTNLLPNVNSETLRDTNTGSLVLSVDSNTSLVEKEPEMPSSAVILISDMNSLLLQSQASYRSMKPRWSSAVDQELLYAKSQIDNAPIIENDPILYAPLYRNVSMFRRSYELMEEILKVYIYKEGERPIFHQAVLKGIYASEGWFLKLLEANKRLVTKDPRKAHLFYLPFSSRMLEEILYVPGSHSHKNLIQYLKNYLDMITVKHPFWNRTGGADHFLVACHDWAPSETKQFMAKCIRALCNADIKEGFTFGKDVSLPETYVHSAQNLLRDLGGLPPSKRSILAFFAGSMHGYLRPILLQHWGNNKDPDMKIFGRMPKAKKGKMNYVQHMRTSKYCICARGYEVNSPRVVEAIFYECVPVIISDNFVPPFFEVLNWESFAVFVLEKDIPNLKNILVAIPEKRFRQMQLRVKKVQQHFLWHAKPVKYDIFHMILHSIWYNRLFQVRPR